MGSEPETWALNRVAQRLAGQFSDLAEDEVGQVVDDCLSRFVDSPIRAYIPLLVERAARTRLQTMSQAKINWVEVNRVGSNRATSTSSPSVQSFRHILAVGRPWAVL